MTPPHEIFQSKYNIYQDWYPHWAGGIRSGGEQDASLLLVWRHHQHSQQDGDHRGAYEDSHQHGDETASRHPRKVTSIFVKIHPGE